MNSGPPDEAQTHASATPAASLGISSLTAPLLLKCPQPALSGPRALLFSPGLGSTPTPARCTLTRACSELGFFPPLPRLSPCGQAQQPPARPERREGHLLLHGWLPTEAVLWGPAEGWGPFCSPCPSSGCG